MNGALSFPWGISLLNWVAYIFYTKMWSQIVWNQCSYSRKHQFIIGLHQGCSQDVFSAGWHLGNLFRNWPLLPQIIWVLTKFVKFWSFWTPECWAPGLKLLFSDGSKSEWWALPPTTAHCSYNPGLHMGMYKIYEDNYLLSHTHL